jgi:hypothetical protein
MPETVSCEAIREALPRYLGGELPRHKSAAIASHLAVCRDCSALEQEERELNHVLRSAMSVDTEAAARLEQQVVREIDSPANQPEPRKRYRMIYGRWWAATAATLVLAISGLYVGPALYNYHAAHVLCSDAADDHQEEVIQQQQRKWRTSDTDLQALVARLGENQLPKSAGNLTLEKARICELGGQNFVHAVYTSGQTEYSVFIAPVPKSAAVRSMPFRLVRAETINNIGVAEFHSNAHMLIVAGGVPVDRVLEVSTQLASAL